MQAQISLSMPQRRQKSYVRGDSRTDTIFTFFRYKQASISFAKRPGTVTRLTDLYAQRLLQAGIITQAQLQAYTDRVCEEYVHKDRHPEQSPEDIYAFLCRARYESFGAAALEQGRQLLRLAPVTGDPGKGIDQRQEKQRLIREKQALIFLLTQPELFLTMQEDIRSALAAGRQVYVCCSARGDGDLPTRSQLQTWLTPMAAVEYIHADPRGICADENLLQAVENNRAGLLFYGEDGFLHCRCLCVDAVVTAQPVGYHAQALCNLLGREAACVVYIPAGLDITPWVSLTAQSRLTFYHLARLSRSYGDGVYAMTPQQLYSRYGREFVNIYDNTHGPGIPLEVSAGELAAFDEARENAVAAWLNSFSNVRYTGAYFDEALNRQTIPWDETRQHPGILVHSVRISRAKAARIMACEKGVTPRQMLASAAPEGTALVSNFLFFLTPKLGTLYNDLRADRPLEQADAAAGHLDYMLCYRDGKRVETFPLFSKTCLAMTGEGAFFFFRFRLGGGSVRIGDTTLSWKPEDVDPQNPGAVCVYTPFASAGDEDADREGYRKCVGADRVNLVILQDRLVCVRKGDVVLPSVGVVLSVSPAVASPLLESLTPAGDGYYFPPAQPVTVRLDPPAGVDPETWRQVRWAYGGGMSLVVDGCGLCDGGDLTEWFRREGWLTPLSRQTQESVLHKLVKHPRTAIGTAKNGDLVILVYSGRTLRSTGADYREMITIARALYPDLENLMNVDGGGSAVLGVVSGGSFMELSYPATSTGSCAGMVRPINTLFYIPAEKEKEI